MRHQWWRHTLIQKLNWPIVGQFTTITVVNWSPEVAFTCVLCEPSRSRFLCTDSNTFQVLSIFLSGGRSWTLHPAARRSRTTGTDFGSLESPEILTFARIAESYFIYKCLQSVVFEEELEKAQNELSKQQLKDQQLKEKIQSLLEKADPFRVCTKLTAAMKVYM